MIKREKVIKYRRNVGKKSKCVTKWYQSLVNFVRGWHHKTRSRIHAGKEKMTKKNAMADLNAKLAKVEIAMADMLNKAVEWGQCIKELKCDKKSFMGRCKVLLMWWPSNIEAMSRPWRRP